MLLRTFARLDKLAWDLDAGTVDLTVTSARKQDVTLLARHGIATVADRAGVGANLRDHLASGILVATRPGIVTLASAETFANLLRWLVAKKGPLTSNVAEAAAFVRSDAALPAPDLELIFAPVPFENEGLTKPSFDGFTVATVLLQPKSFGSVTLRSADPGDPHRPGR